MFEGKLQALHRLSMESMLGEPITSKKTFRAVSNNVAVGCSTMQGWRNTMEDAHTVQASLPEDPDTLYFAVFDGHGGSSVADFASENLHEYIIRDAAYKAGEVKRGMEQAFLGLDAAMQADEEMKKWSCGATANVVLIRGKALFCANVGDSRAVACIGGRVVQLSEDHKPELPEERARIERAGGTVTDGRVNAILAMSRAFGDFFYKRKKDKSQAEQAVSCLPDVVEKEVTSDLEFVVIASDGIWDVMSCQDVCSFVRARVITDTAPDIICEELLEACLAKEPQSPFEVGLDNMTVIVAVFIDSFLKPYERTPWETSPSVAYVCNQRE